MKKKIVSIIVFISVLVLCLAGCGSGSNSKYVGKWVGTSVTFNGTEMEVDQVFQNGFSFELRSDGKILLDVSGQTTSGTWKESENGIVVDQGSQNKVELADKKGDLIVNYSDDLSVRCSKDKGK